MIEGAAHCSDLGSPSPQDPSELTKAREEIAVFFRHHVLPPPSVSDVEVDAQTAESEEVEEVLLLDSDDVTLELNPLHFDF